MAMDWRPRARGLLMTMMVRDIKRIAAPKGNVGCARIFRVVVVLRVAAMLLQHIHQLPVLFHLYVDDALIGSIAVGQVVDRSANRASVQFLAANLM